MTTKSKATKWVSAAMLVVCTATSLLGCYKPSAENVDAAPPPKPGAVASSPVAPGTKKMIPGMNQAAAARGPASAQPQKAPQ